MSEVRDSQSEPLVSQIKLKDALDMVGTSGKYQYCHLLIFLMLCYVQGIQLTGPAFLFIEPPLLCDGKVRPISIIQSQIFIFQPCPTDYCNLNYQIDPSYTKTTLTTDFNIFCDRTIYITIFQSIFFLGNVFGGPLLMSLADIYGRKKIYQLGCFITLISQTSFGLSFNIYQSIISTFFVGFGFISCYLLNMVFLNEIGGKVFRQKTSVLVQVQYSFSVILTPFIYLWIDNWRVVYLCFLVFPMLIVFILTFVILNETPNFYHSKKRIKEMYDVLDKIAKVNGRECFSDKYYDNQNLLDPSMTIAVGDPEIQTNDENRNERDQNHEVLVIKRETVKNYNMLDLFRFKSLRGPSIGLLIISFIIHILYYGSEYSIQFISVSSQVYYIGATMGAFGFLSNLTMFLLIDKIKRKPTIGISQLLAVCLCLSFLFYGTSSDSLKIDCDMCVKRMTRYFNNFTFAILGLYTNECYPTPVRSVGTGATFSIVKIISIFIMNLYKGLIGSFTAPYMIYLGQHIGINPFVLIAVFVSVGLSSVFLIKETFNKPLQDKIQEVQEQEQINQPTQVLN